MMMEQEPEESLDDLLQKANLHTLDNSAQIEKLKLMKKAAKKRARTQFNELQIETQEIKYETTIRESDSLDLRQMSPDNNKPKSPIRSMSPLANQLNMELSKKLKSSPKPNENKSELPKFPQSQFTKPAPKIHQYELKKVMPDIPSCESKIAKNEIPPWESKKVVFNTTQSRQFKKIAPDIPSSELNNLGIERAKRESKKEITDLGPCESKHSIPDTSSLQFKKTMPVILQGESKNDIPKLLPRDSKKDTPQIPPRECRADEAKIPRREFRKFEPKIPPRELIKTENRLPPEIGYKKLEHVISKLESKQAESKLPTRSAVSSSSPFGSSKIFQESHQGKISSDFGSRIKKPLNSSNDFRKKPTPEQNTSTKPSLQKLGAKPSFSINQIKAQFNSYIKGEEEKSPILQQVSKIIRNERQTLKNTFNNTTTDLSPDISLARANILKFNKIISNKNTKLDEPKKFNDIISRPLRQKSSSDTHKSQPLISGTEGSDNKSFGSPSTVEHSPKSANVVNITPAENHKDKVSSNNICIKSKTNLPVYHILPEKAGVTNPHEEVAQDNTYQISHRVANQSNIIQKSIANDGIKLSSRRRACMNTIPLKKVDKIPPNIVLEANNEETHEKNLTRTYSYDQYRKNTGYNQPGRISKYATSIKNLTECNNPNDDNDDSFTQISFYQNNEQSIFDTPLKRWSSLKDIQPRLDTGTHFKGPKINIVKTEKGNDLDIQPIYSVQIDNTRKYPRVVKNMDNKSEKSEDIRRNIHTDRNPSVVSNLLKKFEDKPLSDHEPTYNRTEQSSNTTSEY